MNNFSFFVAKILQRIPFISPIRYKFNIYRHHKNMAVLEPYFVQSLKSINSKHSKIPFSNTVWVFWWQGQENMPLLTKKCFQSLLKNKGSYKVVLITQENVKQYAKLPEYIYKKLQNGQISITHFSDILRFNLLLQYGGLWLDSTVLVTKSLDNLQINKLFTCSGYDPNSSFNVSNGRWTGFIFGGEAGSELFNFMNAFFIDYWKDNNQLRDYFMIDYALNYAWQKNLSEFQKCTELNKFVAPNLFKLQGLLNETYNKKDATNLQKNTFLFKLSNRKKLNLNIPTTFFNNLEKLY